MPQTAEPIAPEDRVASEADSEAARRAAISARARSALLGELRDLWRHLCLERRELDRFIDEIEAVGRCLTAGVCDPPKGHAYTAKDALDHFGPEFIVWMTLREYASWPVDGG